jgi:hypothetical protein
LSLLRTVLYSLLCLPQWVIKCIHITCDQ